jgi:hypothetical protein
LNLSNSDYSETIPKLPDSLERLYIPPSCKITEVNIIPKNIKWLTFTIGDNSDEENNFNTHIWKNLHRFEKLTHLNHVIKNNNI